MAVDCVMSSKQILATLQREFPHQLNEVDITQDATLYNQYRFTIPVLKIADAVLAAPITAVQLKKALQDAARL